LERILEAGLRAPTHDSENGRRFLLVEDASTRAELVRGFWRDRTPEDVATLVDSWNVRDLRQRAMLLDAIPRQGSMLLGAGALVLPCFHQPEPLLGAKESLQQLNAFAEMWACLEDILIAAAAEGILGVTKIPSTPEKTDHIRRTLRIPETYEIACYLALGLPMDPSACRDPGPVGVRSHVFRNSWGIPPW
jgi:nitroreductase